MFERMAMMRTGGPASKPAGLLALVLAALFALLPPLAQAADDFLEPDVAFRFSAKMADPKNVEITFAIADGYYMYRERFAFAADGAKLGQPVLPPGKIKYDDTFKKDVEMYRKSVTIRIPVETTGSFLLKVTSQGCADKGLCYSPMESQLRLGGSGLLAAARGALAGNAIDTPQASSGMSLPESGKSVAVAATSAETQVSEAGRIESSLKSGKLLVILPLFILLGLGLAFTPCVLPMVPILSFIIVGEGPRVSRRRGFVLAAAYSLGMALVYTALGVTAGLLGEGLSATLQQPWILATFGVLMIVFALSMFDVYQLQMPASIQSALSAWSARQSSGKLAGVFLMGAVSALIVGPCVAAPLAAALVYISQTRDVLIGGSALFALAVGMSIPLLLVGLSAGTLLPRAGPWMAAVKRFFGVLMLALALWMVSPLIPSWLQMLGWSALGVGYGAWLIWRGTSGWAGKALGVIFALLGALQLAGTATGGRDPLMPLAHLKQHNESHPAFVRVRSGADLDAALLAARGKTVMLDFYADWCVSCKEMERFTFTDPRVRAKLSELVLLQADVTANNADDKALLKRFGLFGPPGILFFDGQGREVNEARVIGYRNADGFLSAIAAAQH